MTILADRASVRWKRGKKSRLHTVRTLGSSKYGRQEEYLYLGRCLNFHFQAVGGRWSSEF